MAGLKYLIVWVALTGVCLGAARAEEALSADELAQLKTQARSLRQQAKQMRADAKKELLAAQQECWKRTLVSGCQADAKDVQRRVEREAQKVDLDALQIERRIDAWKRADRQAKKAEKERKEQEKAVKRAAQIKQEGEDRQRKLEKDEAKERQRQLRREKSAHPPRPPN